MSDSGTYTCETVVAKKFRRTDLHLKVLRPKIDEPTLRLHLSLSKTRPRQVIVEWSVANVMHLLERQVVLKSYRLEDGSTPLDVSLHVNSTRDTNGTALYAIDPSKDKGKNRYARLEFRYLGGYNLSVQQGPIQMKYEDLKVMTMEHTEQLEKVILMWSTAGMYENEKPTYSIRVFGESKNVELEQETDQTTINIEIKKRPWRFRVEVLPMAGSYTGVKKEEDIQIAERAPTVSPTEVKVIVRANNQVQIRFKPIPNIALYGEDKGCKVEVCEKQNMGSCLTMTTPPQKGDVTFEALPLSKSYSVRAACSTNIGFGPYSNWIYFETTATTPEEAKKKTTKIKAISDRVKQNDPLIELEVQDGFKLIVTWNLKTSDGSNYDLKLVKNFLLCRFEKEKNAESYKKETLAMDASLTEYSTGVTFLPISAALQ